MKSWKVHPTLGPASLPDIPGPYGINTVDGEHIATVYAHRKGHQAACDVGMMASAPGLADEIKRLELLRLELQAEREHLLGRLAAAGVEQRRAVAEERERCARIAESGIALSDFGPFDAACMGIACAIRNGAQK